MPFLKSNNPSVHYRIQGDSIAKSVSLGDLACSDTTYEDGRIVYTYALPDAYVQFVTEEYNDERVGRLRPLWKHIIMVCTTLARRARSMASSLR